MVLFYRFGFTFDTFATTRAATQMVVTYAGPLCVRERECSLYILKTSWLFYLCLLQSCAECTEPTLAQSLCTLCNKWLCYQCTDVHQHQRAPATSQYTDLHPQQRPGATQRPDLHHKSSSSVPPTGQGKTSLHASRLSTPFFSGQCVILLVDLCFSFFVFPLFVC